ncbi:MAG: hypothetical protein K0S47_1186 [Herbinix sp.]|jgi:hypothetical protein|nr:hypothetical protein [Herbinix sp.]
MTGKKLLKILAAATAFFIIGFILYVVNSFTGNPVSANIATAKIKTYVAKNYPDQQLTISQAHYNFKDSSYSSVVQSETSEDTCFRVSWNRGKLSDDYPYEVANHFTTYRRLTEEFDQTVQEILINEFPYETTIVIADLAKRDMDMASLTLDMPFDITSLPSGTQLVVYLLSEERSYKVLAKRLLELNDIMKKHQIRIDLYSLVLEEPMDETEKPTSGESLYLFDFPADQLTTEHLDQILQEHQIQWEKEGEKQKEKEMEGSYN